MTEITEDQIDRAARYLRETQQAGKTLNPWAGLSRSAKKKWIALAAGALHAAASIPSSEKGA